MLEVVPTRRGQDIESPLKSHDAHIRLERNPGGEVVICADVFDSSVDKASDAHVDSRCESNTRAGAAELTEWLVNEWGFDVRVEVGSGL